MTLAACLGHDLRGVLGWFPIAGGPHGSLFRSGDRAVACAVCAAAVYPVFVAAELHARLDSGAVASIARLARVFVPRRRSERKPAPEESRMTAGQLILPGPGRRTLPPIRALLTNTSDTHC